MDDAARNRIMFLANKVTCLSTWADDVEVDKALGELEAAIYSARQAISDEWKAAREQSMQAKEKVLTQIQQIDVAQALKDLGLD